VSSLRLEERDQRNSNNNVVIPESFHFSTPQLLTSFQQPQQPQQPHNEVISSENDGNEISLVIDIPDANLDNVNNSSANSLNINLNAEPGPESSPGSQLGSM
jgi:hypothetical protein